jgi:hypothetical protein
MIDQIKSELQRQEKDTKAYTENGALSFKTSGKKLVDINFKAASYRSKTEQEIYNDFVSAFIENEDLAIKWLFFARDIREGLGERRLFRVVLTHLLAHKGWNEKFERLFKLIAEFGRWDDLLIAFNVKSRPAELFVSNLLETQIDLDIGNMNENKPISICAKWLPSEGATNANRKLLARQLAKMWGLSSKDYRKKINKLKAYLDVTEIKTSSNKWDKIAYEKVPSKANLKYRAAFYKHDGQRYTQFLTAVEKGEAKINSGVNFPHDIVHAYFGENMSRFTTFQHISDKDEALEQLWKALPKYELSNTLVVADGSGSMTATIGTTSVSALDVANALAIYCSENNSGVYRNKYITFSNNPQYVEFKEEDSLFEKLNTALLHNEVASTDIEKVFKLILTTAINNKIPAEEIVKNVLIISDMEFNEAVVSYGSNGLSSTLFQTIEAEYAKAGYKLPKLNFWNVNSRTNTIPVQENENGVALVSGFSPHIMKMVLSEKLDPFEVLIETLNSDRYKEVYWN